MNEAGRATQARAQTRAVLSLGLTAGRTALQAVFLIALPMWVESTTASTLFLAVSVAAFVVPTAALGSQFNLIRHLADETRSGGPEASTYYVGMVVIVVAAAFVSLIYGHSQVSLPFGWIALYLGSNYLRLFADSFAQGRGIYNRSQAGYILFWSFKILIIGLFALHHSPLSFPQLCLLELVASLPWFLVSGVQLMRLRVCPTWNIHLVRETSVAAAGLTRMFWMEADRLLLPAFLTSSLYVHYTLVSRVATGSLALVAAHMARITPQIVRADPLLLKETVWRAKGVVMAAMGAYCAGALATIAVYPLSGELRLLLALGLGFPPLFLWSSVYADYIFYRQGPTRRLLVNIVAASVATLGVLLAGLIGHLWLATSGLLAAYVVCGVMAHRFAVRRRGLR